jgi:light-regulated signal transduction histidine kinase (bacteriophytochrome)
MSPSCEDELSRTREAFREFISVGVHDLREPLRAIGINAELLSRNSQEGASERTSESLRHIQEGVQRMDTLLRDIADYWHGEGQELQLRETDLNAVVEEAQRQISDVLQKNEAIVTYDPLPTATGDFFALAAVFRQFIANACKFRSAEAPRIHVQSTRQGSEWVFSVRDNGIGFKPAYAEIVFQPFKRLNGRHYPGSGLGLPLAKRIVEQHGGRIWVDSTPDKGSTFWFSLPVPE